MSISSAKKSRGRPSLDTEAVNVRMERRDLIRLDAYAIHHGLKGRPEAVRQLVREALGPVTCARCGKSVPVEDTDIHHIVAKAKGGTDQPDNLELVCKACH